MFICSLLAGHRELQYILARLAGNGKYRSTQSNNDDELLSE